MVRNDYEYPLDLSKSSISDPKDAKNLSSNNVSSNQDASENKNFISDPVESDGQRLLQSTGK